MAVSIAIFIAGDQRTAIEIEVAPQVEAQTLNGSSPWCATVMNPETPPALVHVL